MKIKHMILLLLILAWPLYYLYQHQLGAISFLVLAILFFFSAMKELKMLKTEKKPDDPQTKKENIKQNNR
jgi:ABC-type iron transport system FetAB permease component